MTVGHAIEEMLRWLDEATANGQPVPPDQIADLKDRAHYLIDGVVKYIAGQFKIPAVYSVVRAPVKNLLDSGFVTTPYVPPDEYVIRNDAGRSYYLEVYGDCSVTVNGAAVEYEPTEGFARIKGNVAGDAGCNIIVTSEYPFVVRNAAVYPCRFASDDTVQDYIPYVPYELPADFREFDTLLQTSDSHTWRRFPDYRREGLKTFLLPYDAQGQFDFRYFRNPAEIPPTATDDTEIEVQSHAAQLVPLKLAVDVCMGVDDTMTVGYYLDNKFQNTLVNLLTADTGEVSFIDTVYSMI